MNQQLNNMMLLPQESRGEYQFSSPMYMTREFMDRFGIQASLIALAALKKVIKFRVSSLDGADYLQVLQYVGVRFFLIDDVDHITVLLPEDY